MHWGKEGAIHRRNIAKNLEMHMLLAVEMMNHWMKPPMGKDSFSFSGSRMDAAIETLFAIQHKPKLLSSALG